MNKDDLLRFRRLDRWSLRWRLSRTWTSGLRERRAERLGQLRNLEGTTVSGVYPHPGELVANSEVYISDGRALAVSRSHVPTIQALARAVRDGPVRLVRVADHQYFFGLYFHTLRGPLAMLADDLSMRSSGGGLRAVSPVLTLT